MPLQWLPLQQRQKIQPRSTVSEALTPRPRPRPAQGSVSGGFAAGGGTMPNRFVEEQKAKWAEEDKLKKLERDKNVEEAQEMGMRIRDAFEREKLGGRAMSAQALAGKTAPMAAPLTKENMPEAAMETWKFISTLEPESQKYFIQQLKEKELGTGGYIETGGKRVEMPGSLGMYGHLVDKGLIDPATDTVIEREAEPMKGKFAVNTKTGEVYDTTTGKVMIKAGDIPKEVTPEDIAKALEFGRKTSANYIDPTFLEGLNPEKRTALLELARDSISGFVADYLISVHKLSREKAENIANAIPPEEIIPEIGDGEIEPPIGRELPLNEIMAKDIATHFKATPDADIEAYRDEYGNATVDRALEINKGPKPTVEPKPLPYVPSKSEKKISVEPFRNMPTLPYYP